MSIDSLRKTFPCGTRSGYTRGCRCDRCRVANNRWAQERYARMRAEVTSVEPSGPPIAGTMPRGGVEVRIWRCPGANGQTCVRGGGWLRGAKVCGACVERATVWNGLVDASPARAHLAMLSAKGVGYKSVSAAADVGTTTLCNIISGAQAHARAQIVQKILAVTAEAIADAAVVDASATNKRIAELRERGFTLAHLARLIGQQGNIQVGCRAKCTARTEALIAKIHQRALRGELRPARAYPASPEAHAFVQSCLAAGLTERWITNAIGVRVHHADSARMRPEKAAAILAWRDRVREELEHGLPDGWSLANASALADAFSWGGGWRTGGLSRGETPKKRAKPKRQRVAPEQQRERSAQHQRAKRARERDERQQAA